MATPIIDGAHHLQEDAEKDSANSLPVLTQVRSGRSAVEDALDAEANVSPAEPVEPQKEVNSDDPGPPPNGGVKAWLQVAGSFFLFFNCW